MNILESTQRQAVITEAESWLSTPFHHEAMIKNRMEGVTLVKGGVDCGMLLVAVYRAAGLIPEFTPAHYAYQWHLHRTKETYLDYLAQFGREIEEKDIGPGDVVIWKLGHVYSHAAIIVAWPAIIHALEGQGVVPDMADMNLRLKGRDKKFFSPWGK